MKKLSADEMRQVIAGGKYCKICGYGNDRYRNMYDVATHILRKHFGTFVTVYAWNIWKYRSILGWAMGL